MPGQSTLTTVQLDIDRVLRIARELSIPRQAGSEGGVRVMDSVRRYMEEAGLEVAIEPFSFHRNATLNRARILLALLGLCLLVTGLLLPGSPLVALPVLAVSLVGFLRLASLAAHMASLSDGSPPVETANVVGRRRPHDVSPETPAVILVAHHDSKSQSLTFPWRMGATLVAIAASLGVLACLVLALVLSVDGASWPPPLPTELPAASGLVAAAALLLLSTIRNGNRSPGGVDNGGSLALLLELARHLPAAGPDGVEWIFLSPGAEEDYMVGAREFLARHHDELANRRVQALNFDGAGNPGKAVVIEHYGLGGRAAPQLKRLASEVSERVGIPFRAIAMLPGIGIDSIPFAKGGIPCVSWSSGSLGRATLAIHSAGDVADHLDADALRRVGTLGAAMALDMAGLLAVGGDDGR